MSRASVGQARSTDRSSSRRPFLRPPEQPPQDPAARIAALPGHCSLGQPCSGSSMPIQLQSLSPDLLSTDKASPCYSPPRAFGDNNVIQSVNVSSSDASVVPHTNSGLSK